MTFRVATLFAAVLVGSAVGSRPAAAQDALACESFNNSYNSCKVNTRGSVRLVTNLSDTPCVYGRTWGFDHSSIWVDRGCRGRFSVGGSGSGWERGDMGRRVTCESVDKRHQQCAIPTRGDVRLVRQLSQEPCTAGKNWGFEKDGIWVANGCRAEFEVGYNDVTWDKGTRVIRCESNDGRYSRCRTWTYGTVTIQRQLSKAACRKDRNWGFDRDGIWVNDGCRADFLVGAGGGGWGPWQGAGPAGGSVNLVDRGRQACIDKARMAGYASVSTSNAVQAGNSVNVTMQGRSNSRPYDLECVYKVSKGSAQLTSQREASSGFGSSVYVAAKSACESLAKSRGFDVEASGPATLQPWGVVHKFGLRRGANFYNAATCNYNSRSGTATISEGSAEKQPPGQAKPQ
jgi:hypothetical protein